MSTLQVTDVQASTVKNPNTTNGGVAIDSSGHVQVDGLQMPTAGALSNRNLAINGSFQVWQRGTTFTANAAVTFGADRFAAYSATSSANAYTRSTDVPTDQGFTYSGSFDNVDIRHAIELPGDALRGPFVNGSKWTLSFWVKASSSGTGTVNAGWGDGTSAGQLTYWGADKNYTYSTDWEKKELTFTVANNPAAGDLAILLYWGAVAGQKITGVQFERGDKATEFEHRSYDDELTKCQRYYEVVRGGGGMYWGSGNACGSVTYKVEKRVTPSTITASTVHYEYPASSTWQATNISKHGFTSSRSGATDYLIVDATWSVNAEL